MCYTEREKQKSRNRYLQGIKEATLTMRITVFGATGKTGKLLVQQALEQGHDIVALARTPAKMEIQNPRLHVVQGDIQNAQTVAQAIAGSDAVISVLGPTSNAPDLVVSRGMQNILAGMRQENVTRLIISAGAGVGDPADQPGIPDKIITTLLKLVSKNVLQDMVNTVAVVRNSDRDWTIVRVPMLTDDVSVGTLRVGAVGKDIGTRVGRADLAAFLLKQLNDETWLRRAPAISS